YSPDGKQIVFYREKGDQQDQVWTLDLTSRKEERITDGTGHNFFPFYLPDGRIAWSGQPGPKDSTQPPRLWIPGKDGKLTPFGPGKMFFARASQDGKEMLFVTQDPVEKKIYRQPLAGGEAKLVLDVRPLGGK